jgi:hypothetical protein
MWPWLKGVDPPMMFGVAPLFKRHPCPLHKQRGGVLKVGFTYRILALEPLLPFSLRSHLATCSFLLCLLASLCPSSLPTARMVSFPFSLIRESHLLGLEKKGFIPSREASGWRLESEGEVPRPEDDEVVVLESFYECGCRI